MSAELTRAEALQLYRKCRSDRERRELFLTIPVLREIYSASAHPAEAEASKPAGTEKTEIRKAKA